MPGLLGIGTSALLAYQRALGTISHNISNVNTEGYSRQRVDISTRTPQGFSNGFIGNGVDVTSVRRAYDDFLTVELRAQTTSHAELQMFHQLSASLDNLLADDTAGLSPALDSFFSAVQGAADNPTSTAARQVLLSQSDALAARFHELDDWAQGTRERVNIGIGAAVQQINQLSSSIADVNRNIIDAQGRAGGQPPNDLLDKRDQLVRELAEKTAVTTAVQDDGALNVFMGSGQPLVLGFDYNIMGLEARSANPDQLDITVNPGGATGVVVTNLVNGGELGGLLRFREQLLNPTQNALGRIAVELGTFVNQQHRAGMTLDGQLGQDLFSIGVPQVYGDSGNSGSITVTFADVAQLTTDDYHLRFDGASWALTRSGSGQTVPLSGSGTLADPFVADGLSIVIGPGAAAGDNYALLPTQGAAGEFGVAATNPRELALAAPIRTNSALGNSGTGSISAGLVTDINDPAFQSLPGQLSPAVLIRFTSPTDYEVLDQGTLAVIDTGTYDPALVEEIFPTENLSTDFGYRVGISGSPAAGDEFGVEYNSSGVGDNRNALLLAGLQSARLMEGGSASFADGYGQLVADVGTQTLHAQVAGDAQQRILEQSEAAQAAVSGVNLDEEAADLIRFQQAYQAAAQVIAVADQLFDTLINSVRG